MFGQAEVVGSTALKRPGRNRAVDLMTAVVLFSIGLTLLNSGVRSFAEFPATVATSSQMWHILPLAVACVAVGLQRRLPVLLFGVATLALLADLIIGLHLAVLLGWAASVYGAGRYASQEARPRITWTLVIVCAGTGLWILVMGSGVRHALLGVLQISVFAAFAMWWSTEVRAGDEQAHQARARTSAVRRAAVQEQAHLLRSERASLAEQLHDTVSSHLSSIALYTAGALDSPPDAARDRQVLGEIRQSSLSAMEDMRELIDVLRRYDVDVDRTPTSMTILEAIQSLRCSGLAIDATTEPVDLDVDIEQALALVSRESLTNALKYGEGSASVSLTQQPDGLLLVIENGVPEPTATTRPAHLSGGLGLGAMAARVRKIGGSFSSGEVATATGRVWRVRAHLPRHAGTRLRPTG